MQKPPTSGAVVDTLTWRDSLAIIAFNQGISQWPKVARFCAKKQHTSFGPFVLDHFQSLRYRSTLAWNFRLRFDERWHEGPFYSRSLCFHRGSGTESKNSITIDLPKLKEARKIAVNKTFTSIAEIRFLDLRSIRRWRH